MFEGWESASETAQITLGGLVELMYRQKRDITFNTYAKGMLKACKEAPEGVKADLEELIESINNKYSKVAHANGRWSGYEWLAPEQVFETESNFKELLYNVIIEFIFGNKYQNEKWTVPIREFTSTALWKLEPYS